MKKLIYILIALPMLFASCSQEEEILGNESVEMSFKAEIPADVASRASNNGTMVVNKVVCAVFEDGVELPLLRKVIDIVDSQDIVYAPTLIKGRTYDVVFWAMKDNCYNVVDLKAITRNTSASTYEPDFDAFTKSVEVTVTSSASQGITLVRPFAQLNIGITNEEWDSLDDNFNITPSTTSLSVYTKSAFNALAGSATGNESTINYSLTATGNDLTAGSVTYKQIATCFILPDAGQENITLTFTVNDQYGNAIRENIELLNIPFESNYRTNIVGGLLTGTISYTIDIANGFTTPDNNKVIE